MNKIILTILMTVLCASALTTGISLTKSDNNTPSPQRSYVSAEQASEAVTDMTVPPATTEHTAAPATDPVTVQTSVPATVATTVPKTTSAQKKEVVTDAPVTTKKQTKTASEKKISAEEALKIALKHANLSSSPVREKEVELDREKGLLVYEVSFEKGNMEYEYIINPQSGKIIHSKVSRD